MALHDLDAVDEVVAADSAPGHAEEAVEQGAADHAAGIPRRRSADLIVVATPVLSVVDTACLATGPRNTGVIVTDVGSVKGRIVTEAQRRLPPHPRFVGGHPIAGSERDQLAAARKDLFQGATWVLTPTAATDPDAHATLNRLWSSIGAHIALDPARP